jgi:hypothetical protein
MIGKVTLLANVTLPNDFHNFLNKKKVEESVVLA